MANIRLDLDSPITNGQTVTFRSPTNCSQVSGLVVYYTANQTQVSRSFLFADAHGNNVGSVDLFASDVLVKVILDTELNRAYVQNADTNKYLEERLKSKLSKAGGTMTGPLILTEGVHYGTAEQMPPAGTRGRIFFKVVE